MYYNNERALAQCERERENARTKIVDNYEDEIEAFQDDLPPENYDPSKDEVVCQ